MHSLIDSMTGRFYILFLSRNGNTAVPISHSKLDLKACLQNKGVVRRLFGSILISYTGEVSIQHAQGFEIHKNETAIYATDRSLC